MQITIAIYIFIFYFIFLLKKKAWDQVMAKQK
jgi:hypothetical protein